MKEDLLSTRLFDKIEAVHKDVIETKIQATKTNGRVNKLEDITATHAKSIEGIYNILSRSDGEYIRREKEWEDLKRGAQEIIDDKKDSKSRLKSMRYSILEKIAWFAIGIIFVSALNQFKYERTDVQVRSVDAQTR